MSSANHTTPVKWEDFGSPGHPADIGGSKIEARCKQNCKDVFLGIENKLMKETFYHGEGWAMAGAASSQTNSELELLRDDDDLLKDLTGDVLIWEIGPGHFFKTAIVLAKLDENPNVKSVRYIAVDTNNSTLLTQTKLAEMFPNVTMHSIWGDCDSVVEFASKWHYAEAVYVLSLGSGPLSNGPERTVTERIRKWSWIGTLLIGQATPQPHQQHLADYQNNAAFIRFADLGRVHGDFILQEVLSKSAEFAHFTSKDWIMSWILSAGLVQLFLKAPLSIKPSRNDILLFESHKQSVEDMERISSMAGCTVSSSREASGSVIYMISRMPQIYAAMPSQSRTILDPISHCVLSSDMDGTWREMLEEIHGFHDSWLIFGRSETQGLLAQSLAQDEETESRAHEAPKELEAAGFDREFLDKYKDKVLEIYHVPVAISRKIIPKVMGLFDGPTKEMSAKEVQKISQK